MPCSHFSHNLEHGQGESDALAGSVAGSLQVTMSLAAKAFQTSLPLCKETFFSEEMDDHLVLRYQELMKESSRMSLFDLRKLNASLPVASVPNPFTQVLVIGAADDFIVVNVLPFSVALSF
ncbi:hypothetical protein L6452_44169 [Arctium lappa]|uniref:Uncharacterized protein n=1 Tax=Arctium lappa TaxID=4217 RepID=A0ACB8XEE5_ARCLA|nr:hypothetical protein L6452_44169 [Arctium lappa]